MNLTRLQTFVEVVRRGTLAGAADALSFTPSAISQQMAKLEAEVGTPLLRRETGGVGLTEAGRLLHEHALGIVEAVREARAGLDALQAERVKRLTIGACPVAASAVLPRALRLVRRRLPSADLVLEEAAAPATARAVREGRLQVGVWVAAAAGAAATPDLAEVVLRREPLVAALAADHPLARLGELDAADLAGSRRIGDPLAPGERVPSALAMVAAGEGHALVPSVAAEPPPSGVVLRPVAGAPEWELRAARPAEDVLPVGALAAIDALRTASGERRPTTVSSHDPVATRGVVA
jgi:DNA-binding transcriptional LysR family regulator